uniref:Uncharacterized protein n=1 Tax=viral metagenome TaxID=1070528 RepID=A0A6M3JGY2_9ZZZZ
METKLLINVEYRSVNWRRDMFCTFCGDKIISQSTRDTIFDRLWTPVDIVYNRLAWSVMRSIYDR